MEIQKTLFHCSRDGLTIQGTEYRPEGDCLPPIIVSHGFMANQSSVRHYAKRLAQWGFAAYCFDFCGGGLLSKSDGRTTDMTIFTEQADLEAVIAHVQSLPYVDPSRLVLMGCSQGGFVSALTAAKLHSQIAKLALFYPALCIPDDARTGKMMFAKFDPDNIPDVIPCGPMKLGRDYAASVQKIDPFAAIAPYPGQVLILHGKKDAIVDFQYAVKAADAYESRRAGRCTLYLLEQVGHGFGKRSDVRALTELQNFLQQDIGRIT